MTACFHFRHVSCLGELTRIYDVKRIACLPLESASKKLRVPRSGRRADAEVEEDNAESNTIPATHNNHHWLSVHDPSQSISLAPDEDPQGVSCCDRDPGSPDSFVTAIDYQALSIDEVSDTEDAPSVTFKPTHKPSEPSTDNSKDEAETGPRKTSADLFTKRRESTVGLKRPRERPRDRLQSWINRKIYSYARNESEQIRDGLYSNFATVRFVYEMFDEWEDYYDEQVEWFNTSSKCQWKSKTEFDLELLKEQMFITKAIAPAERIFDEATRKARDVGIFISYGDQRSNFGECVDEADLSDGAPEDVEVGRERVELWRRGMMDGESYVQDLDDWNFQPIAVGDSVSVMADRSDRRRIDRWYAQGELLRGTPKSAASCNIHAHRVASHRVAGVLDRCQLPMP